MVFAGPCSVKTAVITHIIRERSATGKMVVTFMKAAVIVQKQL